MLGLLRFAVQTITKEFSITVAYRNLTVESKLFKAPSHRGRHVLEGDQPVEVLKLQLS